MKIKRYKYGAFAVTSMMSDRLNIERSATQNESSWPEVLLSVQTLLNAGLFVI